MSVLFVFLDDGSANLYQVKQWLQPLQRLARKHPVGVLHTNALVSELLRDSGLSDHRVDFPDGLAEKLNQEQPKLLLYPNQNTRNFHALRYGSAVHAWISHGESDKAYMVQNTLKRYDLYFAAGPAALDRVKANLANYNPDRVIQIGRPQLNDLMPEPVEFQRDESSQSRVFYAPTWEGVTRATRYGSVVSHGIGLVKRLHELGHQIVYRPHPLTGSREESFKQADAEIRNFLLHANADEGSQHFIDVSDFGWQLRQLDLMITDVSAVAYDWLATGKPLIVTRPADAAAVLLPAPIFDSLPLLDAQEIDRLDEIILSLTDSGGSSKNALRDLADRYFSAEADSDVLLERAVAQALSLQTQNESSSLDTYRARRSRLGWLRYPNFIIRILAKLVGLWTTASKKEATTPRAEIRNLFVHNSDPFDFESVGAISEELLKTAREDGRVTFVTNQVTTKLWISLRFFWENFRAWRSRAKLFVFASVSVYDAEAVVRQTKPQRILYLKDHPTNLALLRLNGPQHVLYRPESDPAFKPTHSMVMYDVIATNSRVTHEVIRGIVEVSRPGLAKLPK